VILKALLLNFKVDFEVKRFRNAFGDQLFQSKKVDKILGQSKVVALRAVTRAHMIGPSQPATWFVAF